ncbi:MAG: hypothetical protein R3C27_05800 [Hyphomonadaceae bacterium]
MSQEELARLRAERDRLAAESAANLRLLQQSNAQVGALRERVDALVARLAPATIDRPEATTPANPDPGVLQAIAVDLVLAQDDALQRASALLDRGETAAAFALLETQARELGAAAEAQRDPRRLAQAAAAWRRLGAMLAGGDVSRATTAYLQAAQFDAEDFKAPLTLARLYLVRGDLQSAASWSERAQSNAQSPSDRIAATLLSADLARSQRDSVRARELSLQALSLARTAADGSPRDDAARAQLSMALDHAASDAQRRGANAEAVRYAREALVIDEARLRLAPEDQSRRLYLAIALARVSALIREADEQQSLEMRVRSVSLLEALHRESPQNSYFTYTLAIGQQNLYFLHAVAGRWREALGPAERSAALMRVLSAQDPANISLRRTLVAILQSLGAAKLHRRNFGEARNLAIESVDIALAIPRSNPYSRSAREDAQSALENVWREADRRNDRSVMAEMEAAMERLRR